jgi:hypothetical protein
LAKGNYSALIFGLGFEVGIQRFGRIFVSNINFGRFLVSNINFAAQRFNSWLTKRLSSYEYSLKAEKEYSLKTEN